MRKTSDNADVRMLGFAYPHAVRAALEWLDAHLQPLGAKLVPLDQAAGRVLPSQPSTRGALRRIGTNPDVSPGSASKALP